MFRETMKKYGQVFLLFTLLIIVYFSVNNLEQVQAFLSNIASILMPFLLGLLFALILYSPSRKLEKLLSKFKFIKKKSRIISIVAIYVMAILILTILIKFAIPIFSDNIKELVANIPTIYNNLTEYIKNIPEDSIFYGIDFSFIYSNISIENLQSYLSLDAISASIKSVFGFASAIFSLFVGVILSVYILLDRESIMNFISRFSKAAYGKKTESTVSKYIAKATTIFSNFINGQFLDAIIIGTLSTIVLSILNVKYALTLGPLIGIANLIPYFGAIFAVIFVIIITLFTGGFWQAFSVLVFILILQQIDANIINPKILSENLKISPLLVILAVTLGGGLFGFIGMFLGVPVLALIKAIIIDYIESRENRNGHNIEKI